MCRYIESIRVADGTVHLAGLHQQRINDALGTRKWNLEAMLASTRLPSQGVHKIRLVYSSDDYAIECRPYVVKTVSSLKLVEGADIAYAKKFEDRAKLEALFANRGTADDVIIVKDGRLTDATYANLAFWDGTRWHTPATCLLNGVMRQYLLQLGVLSLAEITLENYRTFKKVKLINALLAMEGPAVDIQAIH
ncbi:MAG: aminotransferase class IV [Cyclobacteriaceae bacterium]|jgi:4-amino-4-deoxychorismate lyase|nr:aminotransferase class IV [Cyclobacteriaceae bacterium]